MEIEINKYHSHVQIVEDGYKNAFSTYRLNSEMMKDLIKEEIRCRVLSFRPRFGNRSVYLNGVKLGGKDYLYFTGFMK